MGNRNHKQGLHSNSVPQGANYYQEILEYFEGDEYSGPSSP